MVASSTPESEPAADEGPIAPAESLSYIYLMARELAPMAREAGVEALAQQLDEAARLAADALAAQR